MLKPGTLDDTFTEGLAATAVARRVLAEDSLDDNT